MISCSIHIITIDSDVGDGKADNKAAVRLFCNLSSAVGGVLLVKAADSSVLRTSPPAGKSPSPKGAGNALQTTCYTI